jgi:two-component system NtrC family sensor kinase
LKKIFADFYHSLGFKIFLILLVMLIIFVTLYSTIYTSLHQKILLDTVGHSAYRVSDVIKQSLHRLMLINEREELYRTIQLLGDEPGIENIRIYNKKGEIKFSTKEEEISRIVDMKAEACYDCHTADEPLQSLPMQEKTRIYRTPEDRRVLGMINPIRNPAECSNDACHAHQPDQTILGVLDVQMSLGELDQATSRAKSIVSLSVVSFIILAIILVAVIVYYIIHKPISKLEMGTAKLAKGELDHRIKMTRKDELGNLALSINNMAYSLDQADADLREWSDQLEKRVAEKTAELEVVNKELLQVEKMASLGKMAASVAHELNNPLAGILTYAKLLIKKIQNNLNQPLEKEKYIEKLEHIRSESMRCGNIVRNLLTFARGSATNFQECHLRDIIERALKIVNHHIELAKIKVVRQIDIKPETISCDSDQLLQAFVALLVNAVEAMPDGGQLEISAQHLDQDAGRVIIQIKDTGVGIPDELKDRILEPFFSTKKDQNGVGLGLAVVYGIIQRHDGKIWLQSHKDQGTTFFMELPVVQPNVTNKASEQF